MILYSNIIFMCSGIYLTYSYSLFVTVFLCYFICGLKHIINNPLLLSSRQALGSIFQDLYHLNIGPS